MVELKDRCKQQEFILLIGAAGFGKSHVLNEVKHYLGNRVLVAAYTAMAADLIDGDTIHGIINYHGK